MDSLKDIVNNLKEAFAAIADALVRVRRAAIRALTLLGYAIQAHDALYDMKRYTGKPRTRWRRLRHKESLRRLKQIERQRRNYLATPG